MQRKNHERAGQQAAANIHAKKSSHMKANHETKELLGFLLSKCSYENTTGRFIWIETTSNAKKGNYADRLAPNGYLIIRIVYKNKRLTIMSHRLAFAACNLKWPENVIDHINKNKSDNRIENLRDCTQTLNLARRVMKKRDLPRGVCDASHTNKKNPYIAQIGNKYIGYFPTPELASEAYEKKFLELYGQDWRN